MMKYSLIVLLSFLTIVPACNSEQKQKATIFSDSGKADIKTRIPLELKADTSQFPKAYSNERFKEVSIVRIADHKFQVAGKAQVFEATFSWVIEDGHEELQKGSQMTNAGAPEWGDFRFIVEAGKKRDNSTLTLILFESSPKDGSRQYELPIILNEFR
jgi:hypothetical protein